VPEVSRFLGLIIYMYYNDHDPPHVHARYGEYEMRMEIHAGRMIEGNLPSRARRLVAEWIALHRAELLDNWELARGKKATESHRAFGVTI